MPAPDRAVLILAGGAGTRLWPLSTDDNPKQFLPLFGGRSLLQQCFERMLRIVDPERIFVSTNERYASKIVEQLPQLPPDNILVEPMRRNTAPAIAICCAAVARRYPEAVLGIFPSDQAVTNVDSFVATIDTAMSVAARASTLVTIGIEPTEPNTGFGYLEMSEELEPGVFRLNRFVEKPDRVTAETFLRAGNFVWNAGMFVWKLSEFFKVLERVSPDIARLTHRYASAADGKEAIYAGMPSISIDFAVMEKAPSVTTVRASFDWSDVGSWAAVAQLAGSSSRGRVITADANNAFVQSGSGRDILIVGFDNAAVVESENGILLLNLERTGGLSDAVKKLQE